MTNGWNAENLEVEDASREADWRMLLRGVPLADFEDPTGHLPIDEEGGAAAMGHEIRGDINGTT